MYFWSLTLNLLFFPLFLHRSCVLSPELYRIQTSTPEFQKKPQRYEPSRQEISCIKYEKLVWRAEGWKDGNFFIFVIIPHHGYIYSCNPFKSSKTGGERLFSFGCESAEIHHSMGTMVLLRLHWTEIHQQLNANLLNIIGLKEDIENYLCWFYGMSKQFNH